MPPQKPGWQRSTEYAKCELGAEKDEAGRGAGTASQNLGGRGYWRLNALISCPEISRGYSIKKKEKKKRKRKKEKEERGSGGPSY